MKYAVEERLAPVCSERIFPGNNPVFLICQSGLPCQSVLYDNFQYDFFTHELFSYRF